MKLLIFPLVILSIVLLFSVTGVGVSNVGGHIDGYGNAIESDFVAPSDGVYDIGGHQVMLVSVVVF